MTDIATPVDVPGVLALLDRAVAERGEDFVYNGTFDKLSVGGCYYRLPDNTPACIAGLVVSYVDPELVLTENVVINETSTPHLQPARLFELFSRDALDVLRVAQAEQDQRRSWGEARASARQYALVVVAR